MTKEKVKELVDKRDATFVDSHNKLQTKLQKITEQFQVDQKALAEKAVAADKAAHEEQQLANEKAVKDFDDALSKALSNPAITPPTNPTSKGK